MLSVLQKASIVMDTPNRLYICTHRISPALQATMQCIHSTLILTQRYTHQRNSQHHQGLGRAQSHPV